MSTPIGSHHGGNGSDSGSVNALLSIDSEAKAKIRTLVVDDEHTLRETCAVLLRNEGYDVTVCGRGNDALDLLKRRPFDIALVDLYMSQVDGLRLLQAALATNPDAIVIVMTGNPSVESSIEALRLGAWNYLPKPFAAQHLQIMIGRAAHTVLVGQETREQQADPERGADRCLGVHYRRERRRQGAHRPVHSSAQQALQPAICARQLRRVARAAPRIRDVRSPQRCLHRRRPRQTRPARDRQRRNAVSRRVG